MDPFVLSETENEESQWEWRDVAIAWREDVKNTVNVAMKTILDNNK